MSGLTFLSPLFLIGAIAAAVPILLHLFHRKTEVVIDFPATALTGTSHDCTALPSTMTMHAPHKPCPQPKREPFSLRSLRST